MSLIEQSARARSFGSFAIRRRLVCLMGAACAVPWQVVRAQRSATHRVGFLSGGTQTDAAAFLQSFVERLREIGYREGDNLVLDARYAEYSAERATRLAHEIAALKPAVIVANGGGIGPACRLIPQVPVVFLHSGNPVDAGYADSIARPGRNATGITLLALDLIGKRVELLKQINPKLSRVAFLASPEHAGQHRELAATRAASERLGLGISYYEVSTPAELAAALPNVAADRPDAALLFSDALMTGQRQLLAAFFLKHRIPSASGWSAFPEAGHLLSYGPERHATWRRLTYFVDQIIKGTPPGRIPIELPTVVEMVVNRRTAHAMDLVLSPEILLRADRVIDT
ncbi:MAG TPA: ABC transporter substrate-binding protein [Casimicrobiaceae bacterium]|nr:ABC transporter substrate-binding protein [Casimicrobiaceae bacterium]